MGTFLSLIFLFATSGIWAFFTFENAAFMPVVFFEWIVYCLNLLFINYYLKALSRAWSERKHFDFYFSPAFCRDDPPLFSTQVSGNHYSFGLIPLCWHWHRRSWTENAGEKVKGHRGAATDRERLHQGLTDVCCRDHRATAEETGKNVNMEWTVWSCWELRICSWRKERLGARNRWMHSE